KARRKNPTPSKTTERSAITLRTKRLSPSDMTIWVATGIQTSQAAIDNRFTPEASFSLGPSQVRDRYPRTRGNELRHLGEIKLGSDWKKLPADTCTRRM